jgi:HK97 family phage major capsid protein
MNLLREIGMKDARAHLAQASRMLEAMDGSGAGSHGYIGLSREEIRDYSVLRALNQMVEMARVRQGWNLKGIEGEAHRELSKRYGDLETPAGFYIPREIQERDLNATAVSAGGYLVSTTTGGSYIEVLRNRSVIFRLGAQVLPGQRENLTLPRLAVAATTAWLSTETSQASESTPTLGQAASTPKTVAAYVEISRQLVKQSNPAGEGLVMADLATSVALATDGDAISGPGAPRPLGISNTPGIGGFAGAALALATLTEAQQDILDANAMLNPETLGYATTPAVAKLLKNRQRFTGTDSPLWNGALHDGTIEGVRAISSNQVPAGTMIYGDWSQVLVPEWGVLAVEVNPYANFQAGIVGVRALWSVDVIIRHVSSFTVATSIT